MLITILFLNQEFGERVVLATLCDIIKQENKKMNKKRGMCVLLTNFESQLWKNIAQSITFMNFICSKILPPEETITNVQ